MGDTSVERSCFKKKPSWRENLFGSNAETGKCCRILESKIKRKETDILELDKKLEETKKLIVTLNEELNISRYEQNKTFYSLMDLEKEKTEQETIIKIHTERWKTHRIESSSKTSKALLFTLKT